MSKVILAITMGDPAGIGPEITIKALQNDVLRERYNPVLVGSARVFEQANAFLGAPFEIKSVDLGEDFENFPAKTIPVVEPEGLAGCEYPRGVIRAECGDAAFKSIRTSIDMALDKKVHAVVTNPIHKKALNEAGHHYSGHTEMFRDFTEAKRSAMMLVSDGLRVSHVTTHCAMRQAVDQIKKERILDVIKMTTDAMKALGIGQPRIGVAALNPHASDEGLFGTEERDEIIPAVMEARQAGIDVSDPLPSDTIFPLANGGRFDAVVAMYHDQGHIPVKMLGFKYDDKQGQWTDVSGINVTLGLPILRVSVDHGTAFDQAWKGQASSASLENAIDFAIRMTSDEKPSEESFVDEG
ncbi:MAG: 4-hydroxythreonine-4-phosphate dehydrogenase PdxA [Candidatus Sumerlaeota bacterium]